VPSTGLGDLVEFVLQKKITDEMRRLIAASDDYLGALYPAESNHLVDLDSLIGASFEYYLLWDQGECVGCVGIKLDDEHPELKRLFVDEKCRGRAYGRNLLVFAIERCAYLGCKKVRLETGISQPEALALFEKIGFRRIGPFGSYKPDPLSLFYERALP
jgi:putative acetyltransferase